MKRADKFKNKEYRDGYVAEHVRRGLSYQIRALREGQQWSKADLAKHLGKPASVVSRIEDPSYGKFTIQTLLEIASAFDVGLAVRFVPFSEIIERVPDVSTAALRVPSYEDELNSIPAASAFVSFRTIGQHHGASELWEGPPHDLVFDARFDVRSNVIVVDAKTPMERGRDAKPIEGGVFRIGRDDKIVDQPFSAPAPILLSTVGAAEQ